MSVSAFILTHFKMPGRRLSKVERIFIVKTYYLEKRKIKIVQTKFHRQFPNIAIPAKFAVQQIIRKFDTTGSVMDAPRSGRPKNVTTQENLELVALDVVADPKQSTRRRSSQLAISRRSLQRMLHQLKLYPYIPRLVQFLNDDDYDRRLQFCEIFLNQYENDPSLTDKILWTDEACFKLNGHVNRHNAVYWSDTNPHITIAQELNLPGVNVWAGISSQGLFGPYFFNGTVTGESYFNLLNDTLWPVLSTRNDLNDLMWQQDGAPPHYYLPVRQWLDNHFPNKWIGLRGPVEWQPHSLDLTLPDFFLWGVLRNDVYKNKPNNIDDLKAAIIQSCAKITPNMCAKVCSSVPNRMRSCIAANGAQFEHIIN